MARVAFVERGQSSVGNYLWIGTDDFNVYGAIGGSDGHGPAVLGQYVASREPNGVWSQCETKGRVYVVIIKNIYGNLPGPSFNVSGVSDEMWNKEFVAPQWAQKYQR